MSVSTIDGTIEQAEPGRKAMGVRFFKKIIFRQSDGNSKTIAKAMVHSDLAGRLQPGTSGRFYLFTAFDHRGIHGFRDDKGNAWFHFPKNNEVVALAILTPIALWVLYVVVAWQGLPIFWTILLVLDVAAYFHYRSVRLRAQRQFAADGAYPAPITMPLGAAEPAPGV